jgi:hypothetical protein
VQPPADVYTEGIFFCAKVVCHDVEHESFELSEDVTVDGGYVGSIRREAW